MHILDYPAWKNGKYCKVKDLNVSVLDLGLIHCDATYDVLAVKNNQIENFDAHLSRFIRSSKGWRIPVNYSDNDIEIVIQTLISMTPVDDLLVWIGLTRGIPSSGNPRDLANCEPNIFIYVKPYYGFNKDNSATVCLSKQKRNTSIDQTMKNFSWNDLNLAQWEAIDRGFDTAVLLDDKGYLTEGPGFNVGVIKENFVYAPRHNCLKGTVMDLVKSTCDREGVWFEYGDISPSFVEDCDAMFLTSTAGNVIPVKCFEGKYFNDNEVLTWLQQKLV
jgi:branched-chain amino acid aminotransferase